MQLFSIEYISLVVGFLILLIGIWGILTRKNILKMVIGFSLFDTGTHIIIVALGYVRNKTAPILDQANLQTNTAQKIVDPVPQALVLTAIVIGLGVTALMLVYAMKLHNEKKTLNIEKYNDLKW
ncbi:cation:proton antiporter [Prolixibacter bellariivorans]|jgi:multisubunit Na+/H+ antiporter MnhC subunit|uniref:Cation:proton antiporter n=1 Tax=Prolixibacter bellariivorans TaxID=314319 RepID=A0A5M4B2A8_9BACT|nr:cation:proton antiporter subunit C [Prolixibacter bellariivorans]GET34026.1 cation:proton antiporter [Prolixibacter bellariivorans]